MASWEVEFTDQFKAWWETLGVEDQRALTAAVQLLERDGPALGRPLADTIKTSRHPEHEGAAAAGDGPSGALRLRPAANRHPLDWGQQAAAVAGVVRRVRPARGQTL